MKKSILCFFAGFFAAINVFASEPTTTYALVRDLADSFEESLKLNPPPIPIDLKLAKQQHETYIDLLKMLIPNVIRINADENHPDCNFIEDTAIIVGDTVIISRMGALERRGEEEPVILALEKLGMKNLIRIESPGTLDGGDILYTGKHLFAGLSSWTNEMALNQLKEIFQGKVDVIGVPVTEGLHLKSLLTRFDQETLVIADSPGGRSLQEKIEQEIGECYNFVYVPDSVSSNVLKIGSNLVVQRGFPKSEKILQDLCDRKKVDLFSINLSELIKADGALTCGSLLFNLPDSKRFYGQ